MMSFIRLYISNFVKEAMLYNQSIYKNMLFYQTLISTTSRCIMTSTGLMINIEEKQRVRASVCHAYK